MKATRRIRVITALSLSIVALSSITWYGLGHVSGKIARVDVFGALKNRPDKPNSALNYLVVGSDTREGLTKAQQKLMRVGSTKTAAGGRSDTMMLVHISKNRDRVFIISLPRDSYVTIPEHLSSVDHKTVVPASKNKLNASFAFGGAPLLVSTVENATGLKIDHYIEVSFASFANLVDALGGVDVCTKTAINDPKSHLVLAAGVHTLDGVESLKYVRARDFDGRGDIGRMARQQQFISAIIRKVTSTGTLLNPVKLLNTFNAAIATLRSDEQLDENDLLTLMKQMRNLSSGNVRTLTVPLSNPNGSAPGVGSVVIWSDTLGTELFSRLKNDQPIVDEVTPSPSASKSATPTIVDKFKSTTAQENPCGAIK